MSPSRSLAAVGLIAVVALAGCAGPGALDASEAPEPSPSAPPAPSASEPAPSEEPEGIDTSDWVEYASEDGELALRYPADWTIATSTTEPTGPTGRRLDLVELTAPNGQPLLTAYDFIDLGGACPVETQLPVEVLATEPLGDASTGVTIATLAIGTVDGRWTFGAGLLRGDVETGDTCYVNFDGGSGALIGTTTSISSTTDDPLWTVDSLDDATAYMETEEYATILEVLRSVVTS